MKDDLLVREAVDRLLPEERPDFLDEFWTTAAARDRTAARRWRRTALAAGAVALLALSAAGVIAAPFRRSNVVDQKLTCSTLTQGGLQVFSVAVSPTREEGIPNYSSFAQAFVTTGGDAYLGTKLVALDNGAKGYMINRTLCRDGRSVPFSHRGLPLADVLVRGVASGVQYRCLQEGKIAVRVRLTQGTKGEPVKAQIEVRTAKTGKPVVYADWTPKTVTAWAAPDCTTSQF